MLKETDEMRQARHDLQLLSASDPVAYSNMMRHVAAYSFAFGPGQPPELIGAPVPGDFDAGVRRAEARMRCLPASGALRTVHREGCLHCIRIVGQEISPRSRR